MRLIVLAALLTAAFIPLDAAAQAQTAPAYRGPDVAAQAAAMQRLAPLVGRWQGEAQISGSHAMTVHQSELVETALDGRLIIFRGTGFATAERTGTPVFRAFAVVSYDDRRGVYEFRSYAYGYAGTSTGAFAPDGAFVWSPPASGPVQTRFTIRFDANTWHEVGETSRDGGQTWTQTIDMRLSRAH